MAELSTLFINIASKFDNKGIDDAINKIDDVGKKTKNMTAGLQTAGLAFTAFAIAGVAGLTKLASSAIEAEKASSELASAMKNAGTYTEQAYKHNLEYAQSLEKITTADDETIMSVQKALTYFGVEGEMLDKLTKATLDFASARGIDAVSAGELLAKTIGSETNALARYGIQIEGSAGSTKRMQSAVEGITALFGGSAQAQAQTFAGRLQQLKNRFDDLLETLGTYLFPILDKLLIYFNNMLGFLERLPPEVQKLAVQFLALATAGSGVAGAVLLLIANLASLITKLSQVGEAIKILNLAMKGAGAIGIVLALATAVWGLVEAYGAWAKATDERKASESEALKTEAGKIAQLKEINKFLEAEGTKAKQTGKDTTFYTEQIDKNNNAIKTLTATMNNKIKQQEKNAKISSKLSDKEIKEMTQVKQAQLEMSEIRLKDYRAFLVQMLAETVANSAEQYALKVQIYKVDQELFDKWRTTTLGGWIMFLDDLTKLQIDYSQVFKNTYAEMTNAVSTALVTMYTEGVDTWDKFSKVADTLWQSIKMAVIKQVADLVAQVIVKFAVLKAVQVAHGLAFIAVEMAQAVASAWKWLVATLSPFGALLVGGAITNEIAKKFDSLKGDIAGLAVGGLAVAPRLAMVGEAGAEAILPLESPRTTKLLSQAMPKSETKIGGDNINITVPYTSIPDKKNAKKMAKILGDELFNNLKRNRRI